MVGMDLPVFHLDFFNNRGLIAVTAILHVVINHGMAVGGIPLVAWLEWRAWRGEHELDEVARRILAVFFVITTTIGALTGVGIWLTASLINPIAIGSLLRVFFWTWFTEWLVFVTEVVLIMAYFLSWQRWRREHKGRHVRLGQALSVASWITMSLIVSILGFMMDPGAWLSDKTLFSGMLNPIYLPQLAFRTPLAMMMAGTFALVVTLFVTPSRSALQWRVQRLVSRWTLAWILPCIGGGLWYAHVVPPAMQHNVATALGLQSLQSWSQTASVTLGLSCSVIAAIVVVGAVKPQHLRPAIVLVPAVIAVGLIGTFERVREFVRKPWAIAGYLYANGLRAADYPLLQRDGLLTHATYTSIRTVTDDNQLAAGKEVFTLACTRCHTVDGVAGIRGVLVDMYGDDEHWDGAAIADYIGTMHNTRPFMPPFPGSVSERRALGAWLASLQTHRDVIEGAQTIGAVSVPRSPPTTTTLPTSSSSTSTSSP